MAELTALGLTLAWSGRLPGAVPTDLLTVNVAAWAHLVGEALRTKRGREASEGSPHNFFWPGTPKT